jgi:hypothetical protein
MTNLNVEKQFALEHFAEWLPEMLRYILHAKDERIVYEAGETVAHVAFMLHPELRARQPKIEDCCARVREFAAEIAAAEARENATIEEQKASYLRQGEGFTDPRNGITYFPRNRMESRPDATE